MRTTHATVLAVAVATTMLVAGCGGGSSSPSTGSAAKTIKLGVLVDQTGPAAALASGVKGVEAYVNTVNASGGVNGQKLSYVTQDTTSTPAGTLLGAQKLVQQDKAFAIISIASNLFAAEPYLLKANVPVIGFGLDGSEWDLPTNTNMFDYSPFDYTKAYAEYGQFFKSQGATSCAVVGYSDSPSSTGDAKGVIASCEHAGLKAPSLNLIKFSSTDVGPVALAIKNSGADSVYMLVQPPTGFAIAAVLQELGVHMKSILFGAGYGGDLLASPAGIKAAQGYSFQALQIPVELNTPATKLEMTNFGKVGVHETPTLAQTVGYMSMSAFVAGLKASGANPTQASFITAMRGVKGFTADGLSVQAPYDFSNLSPDTNCIAVAKLAGKVFVPTSSVPYCGGVIGSS